MIPRTLDRYVLRLWLKIFVVTVFEIHIRPLRPVCLECA